MSRAVSDPEMERMRSRITTAAVFHLNDFAPISDDEQPLVRAGTRALTGGEAEPLHHWAVRPNSVSWR